MSTTNYFNAFIGIADDCPTDVAQVPPVKGDKLTIANRQYEMVADNPFVFTSDDVLFEVFAQRSEIAEHDKPAARAAFFEKGQPCFRASPLPKRYGWGVVHDSQGRIALVAVESDEYAELVADPTIDHVKAMRSSRA